MKALKDINWDKVVYQEWSLDQKRVYSKILVGKGLLPIDENTPVYGVYEDGALVATYVQE